MSNDDNVTEGLPSKISTIIRSALGEYAETADFKTFSVSSSSGPRNDLARLVGVRLVTAAETGSGQKLDEAVISLASGGRPAVDVFEDLLGESLLEESCQNIELGRELLPEGLERSRRI